MTPWLRGFDGPLAVAIFLLACAGMLVMYTAGHDQGDMRDNREDL